MQDTEFISPDKGYIDLDLLASKYDSTSIWSGAPPNWGQFPVQGIDSTASVIGVPGQAMPNPDSVYQMDPAYSEMMRADCGVMECLEARYRATSLLPWHLEPSNPKDPGQKDLCDKLTKIIKSCPDFIALKMWLLEAIYFGRSGVAMKYANETIDGMRRIVPCYWEPRHGDKYVFRIADGEGKYNPEQVGIRVSAAPRSKYLNRNQLGRTIEGMCYWYNPNERRLLILHKHLREDGPYDDPYAAGRIHGYGIRSRIHWTHYAMNECLHRALEYLDRAAFGMELWRFPGNSVRAKVETEQAAKRVVGGGRSIILVPTFPGDMADAYGVEHIEPGLEGFDRLMTVIKEFFQMKIKRYIMGQTLTSEAYATGMGSGVADAHLATFGDIVSCDSQRLAETLTRDFVRPLQLWNFPKTAGVQVRLLINTESEESQERMAAIEKAYNMGYKVRVEDVSKAAGIAQATDDEAILFNPQLVQAMAQAQAGVQVGGHDPSGAGPQPPQPTPLPNVPAIGTSPYTAMAQAAWHAAG